MTGNERLQEMMGIMAKERGGQVFATDERWNGLIHTSTCPLILIVFPDFASTMGS